MKRLSMMSSIFERKTFEIEGCHHALDVAQAVRRDVGLFLKANEQVLITIL